MSQLLWDSVYVGDQEATAVYLGDTLIWGTEIAPPSGGVLALSSVPLVTPTFPISIRSDSRGFIDSAGKPYLGIADTAWNAMSRATIADWTTYCQTRRSQGYTSVLTSILDIQSRTRTQVTTGVTPFTGTGGSADFTAPNQTYFNAVKQKIEIARDNGLFVWLVPGWYGYRGNMWRPNWGTNAAVTTIATTYGSYLAAQFGAYTNVGWLHGGDNGPTTGTETEGSSVSIDVTAITNAHASTIKANSAINQLATYHANRTAHAYTWFGSESWYDIHAAYAATDVPAETTVEWARGGKPVFMVEGYYENPDTGSSNWQTAVMLRNTAYHSILTGAFIEANGQQQIWTWDDMSVGLAAPGAQRLKILSRVLASYPTAVWTPDAAAPLVTSNRGSGTTLSPGMKSSDNENAIIYIPSAKTVTIDTTSLNSGRVAMWVNPDNAATETLTLTGGAQSVTTPAGWSDAVIMIGSPD